MKKFILGFVIAIGMTSLVAFTVGTYEAKKSTAEVESMQGLLIFTDSKPITAYDYLGTSKATIGFNAQYTGIRDQLIKKAKAEFPNADGLIMHMNAGGSDRCDAIKFKE